MSTGTPDLYIPAPDSLAQRVVSYFARLPDEELGSTDIAMKWQADFKNVGVQLKRAVDAGLLERDGSVYKAGPHIGRVDLTPQALARSAEPALRKPRVVPDLDIEAITLDEHVPIGPLAARLPDRWKAKMAQMRPGQSFAVDMAHRHGVSAAATALRKRGMNIKTRREGAEQLRVFCLAPEGSAP